MLTTRFSPASQDQLGCQGHNSNNSVTQVQKHSNEGGGQGTICRATKLCIGISTVHFFTALPLVIIESLHVNQEKFKWINYLYYL